MSEILSGNAASQEMFVPNDAYPPTSEELTAVRHGATEEEIMEAIWVAAEMRAGGAYAHATLAMRAISEMTSSSPATASHA